MSIYVTDVEGGRLWLDTDKVSAVLIGAGTDRVNAIAKTAAETARGKVRPSGKRFIGFRSARPFQMQSADIGRPRSPLSSQLRGPVALVFNNSRYALEQEVGSLSRDLRAERPLTSALKEAGAKSGVRAVRTSDMRGVVNFGTASRASRRKKGRRR
jgi:hypothetical protein